MASASDDETIKLWDLATGQETLTLKGHDKTVECVASSPDGKQLASGSGDKTIKLWDVATGEETATLNEHTNYVMSVAFSPDGRRLASASCDRTIKLWDLTTGQSIATLTGHKGRVMSVAFTKDGKTLPPAVTIQRSKFGMLPAAKSYTLSKVTAMGRVCCLQSGWKTAGLWQPRNQNLEALPSRRKSTRSSSLMPTL